MRERADPSAPVTARASSGTATLPFSKRLRRAGSTSLLRCLYAAGGRLPAPVAFSLFRAIAWAAFAAGGGLRRRTLAHLALAFGKERSPRELRRIALGCYEHLVRSFVEVARLPGLTAQEVEEEVTIEGLPLLDAALVAGRGAIVVTGHIGNWELLAAAVARRGYPVTVVATPLYDARLERLVLANRAASGVTVVSRDGPPREILRVLRGNGLLGVLIDQDTRVDGVFVPFLGTLAHTPVGPVRIAEAAGAPVFVATIRRLPGGGHRLRIGEEVPLAATGRPEADRLENVRRLSLPLEAAIREEPAQWVWMHRRWKTRPEGEGE